MSAGHDELLSDLGKYKKVLVTACVWGMSIYYFGTIFYMQVEQARKARKAMEALERFAQNLSVANTCSREVRAELNFVAQSLVAVAN